MSPPNPQHLGVILKASAKASPAVTLWCLAGAWGELVEEAIRNINPFDKTHQAQVRAQIKRDHQGEVVWMVIDPNNLAHRRAIAYAFSQGKYGATRPNFDFENTFSQDMALMAFYKSKRAVKYEDYVRKMKCQGREPRLSNYSMQPRNDESPSNIHGLVSDSGMLTRSMNRKQNTGFDTNFDAFVLRQAAELTNADIAALSSGINDLIILAQNEASLSRENFLNSLFFNWNTSFPTPGDPPKLPDKIASDASIVCGSWKADCYTQSERSQAKAAGKSPGEMEFPERPAAQKAGAEALINVRLGMAAPTGDFLRMALRNFDYRDGANCRSANTIMLIWLARRRLYHWYSLQGGVDWDQLVEYTVLEEETVFQPRRPFRSYFQVFGSARGEGMGMRNATAGDNYYPRWLGG